MSRRRVEQSRAEQSRWVGRTAGSGTASEDPEGRTTDPEVDAPPGDPPAALFAVLTDFGVRSFSRERRLELAERLADEGATVDRLELVCRSSEAQQPDNPEQAAAAAAAVLGEPRRWLEVAEDLERAEVARAIRKAAGAPGSDGPGARDRAENACYLDRAPGWQDRARAVDAWGMLCARVSVGRIARQLGVSEPVAWDLVHTGAKLRGFSGAEIAAKLELAAPTARRARA